MTMTKAIVWDQDLTELLGKRQKNLLIDFYRLAYKYYELTGHDIIENPEKQDMLIQRATDKYVMDSLIAEKKEAQAGIEKIIADTIISLERLATQSKNLLHEFPAMHRIREEALKAAREGCNDILNITLGKIELRHFTLTELSRRGLYFSTNTEKRTHTAQDNDLVNF
jgi:hypothetical protein